MRELIGKAALQYPWRVPIFSKTARLAILWLPAGLLSLSPGNTRAAVEYSLWLPLIFKPSANPTTIHKGIATFYNANGDGACMFGPSPEDLMIAAINAVEYENAAVCGAYVHIIGPKGEVTDRFVDLCPKCQPGHLDLSQEAFGQIAEQIQGQVDITWQVVSPDLAGPIASHFKDGSNQWWTAVQIRNHRNPVIKFEYLDNGGQWVVVV